MNGFCRYKDIITYKKNRVILRSTQRYINASWIDLPYPKKFIATQGPMPHTIEDFWTMCYEKNVGLIIMLCQLKEKNVEKCADYWNPKKLNNFEIRKLAKKEENGLIIRNFQIINKREKSALNIDHYQLLCWEDHTALSKDYFKKIIAMINAIDQYRKISVVHCSAGIGRTGVVCVSHQLMNMLSFKKDVSPNTEVDIFSLVKHFRSCRPGMVQTGEQYRFCYRLVAYEARDLGIISVEETDGSGASKGKSDSDSADRPSEAHHCYIL